MNRRAAPTRGLGWARRRWSARGAAANVAPAVVAPIAVAMVVVGLVAGSVQAAPTLAAAPAASPVSAPRAAAPTVGPWRPDGPTRTVMDAVTPLGAAATALLSQGPGGTWRSTDGGRTWAVPGGLPAPDPDSDPSSSNLAVLATDRDRAWLAMTGTIADALLGDGRSGGGGAAAPGAAAGGQGDPAGGDPAGGDPAASEVVGPRLLVSADAGGTWMVVPGDGLAGRIVYDLTVVPSGPGDPVILAADATAGILRSEDGGRTFAPAIRGIEPDPDVGGIVVGGLAAGGAAGVAYASTTGRIWRTADTGLTWQAACVASEVLPCGRPFVAPGDPSLVLGAAFGGVSRSTDGGRTWSRVGTSALPGPEDGGIDTIAFSAGERPVAWASGPRGIFRSTDGGTDWETWDGGLGDPGFAASDRVAIDPRGRARAWRIHGLAFFTTDDGGRTWTELPGPDAAGIAAYAALADSRGTRLVGTADGIVLRTDLRWETTRADAIATDIVSGAPASRGAAGGPGNGGAADAEPDASPGVDPGAVPPVVYAATYASGVLRSADGGASWEEWSRGLPRAPAWAVVPPASEGGRVLVATDAGAFERATDAPSWARLGIGLPDAAVRTLEAMPDGSLLAGLETRGVWRLPRGIDAWQPGGLDGRSILSLAVASVDGRVLLAATDRRGLWRSVDAGRTWRRVASTRASAAVAWDPVTGVAVVATGPAILASGDGGRTWRSFTAGLGAADPARPWMRSATGVRALPDGGFVLTTLGGTWIARPEPAQ